MSGASINKKIQKSFGKVGKKIGYKFQIYRSVDFLTPIQTKNKLGEAQIAYSTDASFKAPVDAGYKQVNLFLDTTNIQLGDIFVNEELGKTFVLINKDPIVTPQAIETTHSITISRPGYSTTGEFSAGLQDIVKDIPAAVYEVGSGSSSSTVGEVKNSSGVHKYTMWVWLPENDVKLNDVVKDSAGNESYITSIEFSVVGYKITTQSTKVGS